MNRQPPDPNRPQVVDESEQLYCYGHPKTPTRLRCSRCERPICGRCAIPVSVGQHCPECVAEARKSAPKVRSALRANAPGVYAIIGINVVVWIIQLLVPDFTGRFADVPQAVATGEWWRLITSMFMHADAGSFFLLHILLNCYILYIYGPEVEQLYGTPTFLAMYLTSGFLGNAFSYAFGPFFISSLGASGAVFGVVGILIAYLFKRRHSAALGDYLRGLLFFVGLNLVFGFTVPGINNWAHIGGLVGGLALGALMDRRRAKPGHLVAAASVLAIVVIGVTMVVWRTTSLDIVF
ncbi:MAG: rhomboid family intramembrane serine protease [Actinomycetota bacterium]